jgi:hypothetical protein
MHFAEQVALAKPKILSVIQANSGRTIILGFSLLKRQWHRFQLSLQRRLDIQSTISYPSPLGRKGNF